MTLLTAEQLAELLPDFLARQRWFGGDDVPEHVDVEAFDVLREEFPGLVWALARIPGDVAAYQLLVGLRPLEETESFLEGKGRSFLGDLDGEKGPLLAYDALVDPDLAPVVLAAACPDEQVGSMRPLAVEQSNTSVVFDDRLILKVFRRVHDDPNPDVEIIDALAAAGYRHVPAPLATWRRDGRDLAVVREFLGGGAEGWQLALTSLRDLYDRRLPPEESGGDLAPEMVRLGETTATLHLTLADAFGVERASSAALADGLRAAATADLGTDVPPGVNDVYDRLAGLVDAGAAMRIHGDLHLGQVLRTDEGWFLLDFEGEPRVPVPERRRPSSALRDVAGMLRSFHYAAEVGLQERLEPADDELRDLADRWIEHNRGAYLRGYLRTEGIDALLPVTAADRQLVLSAFEVGKAVYEIGYERAHRPEWEHIPVAAVERLIHGSGVQ